MKRLSFVCLLLVCQPAYTMEKPRESKKTRKEFDQLKTGIYRTKEEGMCAWKVTPIKYKDSDGKTVRSLSIEAMDDPIGQRPGECRRQLPNPGYVNGTGICSGNPKDDRRDCLIDSYTYGHSYSRTTVNYYASIGDGRLDVWNFIENNGYTSEKPWVSFGDTWYYFRPLQ